MLTTRLLLACTALVTFLLCFVVEEREAFDLFVELLGKMAESSNSNESFINALSSLRSLVSPESDKKESNY